MKRYLNYMASKKPKENNVQEQKTEKEEVKTVSSQSSVDVSKTFQKQLREKNSEFEKLKKEHSELMKKQEELLAFQAQALKEKENNIIRSEISKVAKKYNILDSALEDVIGLVSPKLKVQGEVAFHESIKEEDGKQVVEPQDVDSFIGSWLSGKDYYVQVQQAKPSGISPIPSGPKPIVKNEPQSNKHGKQIFSTEDFFKK